MDRQTRAPMEEDVTLERLTTGDVLTQNGSELALTGSFRGAVDRIQANLGGDTTSTRSYLEKTIENDDLVAPSVTICEQDSTPIAGLLALREHLDIAETHCVQLLPVLDQFLRGVPESTGTPEPFVPSRGDLLHLLIPVLQRGIVYFWRYECNPCDLVKGDFEEYFGTSPPDMALLSVYGPNWIDDVEGYDVGAAPTILFLRAGRIDARLVGAFPPKALQKEIEKIRELSQPV